MEKNQTINPLNVLEVMLQEKALLTRTQKEKETSKTKKSYYNICTINCFISIGCGRNILWNIL